MGLSDGQIWLKNQKAPLQKDKSLSITVGFMSSAKPIGITKVNVDGVETSSVTQYAIITIDIFGNTDEVINRKEEIIMALNSSISNEMQNKYGMKISSHPLTFNDVSGIDGAAIPYRFQFTFALHFIKSKKTSFDEFDTFSYELKTE